MQKMRADSLADLVRMAAKLGRTRLGNPLGVILFRTALLSSHGAQSPTGYCEGIDQHYRPIDCHRSFWLNRVVYRSRPEGAYMSGKKTASERCLVIEARWYEPLLRRFVFALRDEESLRERIAGVSVVGIGLGVCKAAAEEKLAVDCEGDHCGGQSPRQDPRHRVGLSETRRIARATLQYAIAASVLVFYSKNVLGAALRALLGG